jgi:hypothetical protein
MAHMLETSVFSRQMLDNFKNRTVNSNDIQYLSKPVSGPEIGNQNPGSVNTGSGLYHSSPV